MFAGEIIPIVAYTLILLVVNRETMVIRIGEEKQEEYTDFTWFGSVPTSMGTTA